MSLLSLFFRSLTLSVLCRSPRLPWRRLGAVGVLPLAVFGLLAAFIWLMNAEPSQAQPTLDPLYVTVDGTGDVCSVSVPCALQTAVAVAVSGQAVYVAGGTYTNSAAPVVITITTAITLTGGFDASSWNSGPNPAVNLTILDGEAARQVVRIVGNISPVIENFEIVNGRTSSIPYNQGAGIYNQSGTPIIRHNKIYNNQALSGDQTGAGLYDGGAARIEYNEIYNNSTGGSGQGGGIYIANSGDAATYLLLNQIYNNSAGLGAGIRLNTGEALLEANTIYNNTASIAGGGLFHSGQNISLYSNLFYANSGDSGGAMVLSNDSTLWNNTLADNEASGDGGGAYIDDGTIEIHNTIIAFNNSGSGEDGLHLAGGVVSGGYNNVYDDSIGSITFTPVYTFNPTFRDQPTNDYHLHPVSLNVDAGDPGTPDIGVDVDGQPRPFEGAYDVGADEYGTLVAFTLEPAQIRNDFQERGTTAVYSHTLRNTGTDPDTFSFSCTNDRGWLVTCPSLVQLDPLEETTLTTLVAVTGTARTRAQTVITAVSANAITVTGMALIETIVSPHPALQFAPNHAGTALPGEMITFTHLLTNTGDAIEQFNITLLNASAWATLLPSNSFALDLAPGSVAAIQIRFAVPANAAAGLSEEVVIQASSDFDPGVFQVVTDTLIVRPTVGTRYVLHSGTDTDNNCTQSNTPCHTIGHAVGQASFGDEIRIAGGQYFESGIPVNDTLYLSGGWSSNFRTQGGPENTVVDGAGNTLLFNIAPGSAVRPQFSNMTLQNGANAGPGGAVFVGDSAQPRFTDVIFQNNQANGHGGAIYAASSAVVTVEGSRFISNTTSNNGGALYGNNSIINLAQSRFVGNMAVAQGGAVHISGGQFVAGNNLFHANQGGSNGGAIYLNGGQITLWHNTLINNQAGGDGGAIYNNGTTAVSVGNSLLVENSATSGGAIFDNSGSLTLSYSGLWQNSLPEVNDPNSLGSGNINADPLFRDEFFRLDRGSPALDVGDPATPLIVDFEDDFRPADNGFDMGWDERAGCRAQRDGIIYGSIQEAINAPNAVEAFIRVTGICRGVNVLNVNGQDIYQTVHLSESLTIEGGWNSDFTQWLNLPTFVDPEGNGRGFYVSGNVTPTLANLSIVNGDASGLGGGPAGEDAGGGVYNLDSALILQNVRILTSTAVLGGGFYNHNGTPLFRSTPPASTLDQVESPFTHVAGNTAVAGGGLYNHMGVVRVDSMRIYSNTATNGGGLYNAAGPLVITNTVIYANEATEQGGGLYNATSSATLWHLTLFANAAGSNGGGFFNESGNSLLRNAIFQSNHATSGPAIFAAGGTVDLDYNYYHDHADPAVAGADEGSHSITDNATPPGLQAPNSGNFHLADTAAAVDVGDPNSPVGRDFDGEPRPGNQGPDMGADELTGCYVDLNGILYGSIQAALDNAEPGDVLKVAGVCSGVHPFDTTSVGSGGSCGGNIQVTVHLTKSVHLSGGWDIEFREQSTETPTLLDARQLGRVMYVSPGITATVTGFDLLNGLADNGGAICSDNAAPVIQQNRFYSNTATSGGAIYSANSAALVTGGNHFYNNGAEQGGAVAAAGATAVTVQNNFIYSNTATSGGTFYNQSGNHNFWHNTTYNNTADNGGAVYVAAGTPSIRSNIFSNNTAVTAGAVFAPAGVNPNLGYNNYFNNSPADLSANLSYGAGYLTADPLFNNLAALDFAIPITSPVVDAADPTLPITVDFEGDLRPSHQGADMGADEFGGCFARTLSNPETIYGVVQTAVAAAEDDDTVQVSGTCYGVNRQLLSSNTSITQTVYVDKNLTISGQWNYQGNVTATLDALYQGRVMYIAANASVTITNLIMHGGDATDVGLTNGAGGAIFNEGTLLLQNGMVQQSQATLGGGIYNTHLLTLDNGTISGNIALRGAGLFNDAVGAGGAYVTHGSRFQGNVASQYGGAVYQNDGALILDGNKLFENSANEGGAIYLAGGNNAIDVWNNFIYANTALNHGAGVYNLDTNGRIWHNTIVGNQGDGLYSNATASNNIHSNIFDSNQGTGIHTLALNPDIVYNIVVNNNINYGGTAVDAATDPTNQNITPLYVSRAERNYHLDPESPGVDEGDENLPGSGLNHDYDGHLRPTNAAPDIGADEINSCYIRVTNPNTNQHHYFGQLQNAIYFAEGFPNPNPTVRIARGTCSGVELEDGTYQVGYVSEDLHIIGSLQRSNFSDPQDFYNDEINALSTAIDALGEGRVFKIAAGVNITLEQVAMVNGNAFAAGDGNTNGGALYFPGPGHLLRQTTEACQSTATNGGGYFVGSTATAYVTGAGTGSCYVARFDDNDQFLEQYSWYDGNVAMNNGGGGYISNGAEVDIVNHGHSNNEASNDGGGLYNDAQTRIINGIFNLNVVNGDGAGIFNAAFGSLAMYHNTLRDNWAISLDSAGGGINHEGLSLTLNSSILYANWASGGDNVGGGLHIGTGSGATLSYNNFDSNLPLATNTGDVGVNPIVGDPQFAFGVVLSQDSPNIDRADPALLEDVDNGGVWPDGIDFDAGNWRRPDVHPDYGDALNTSISGYASDVGADEYWKEFGCDVQPNNENRTVLPGESATYLVTVYNAGFPNRFQNPEDSHGYTDTITITMSSSQEWAMMSGGAQQVVELDYWDDEELDDRISLVITVTVPITASFGVAEETAVTCQSASLSTRQDTTHLSTYVGLVASVTIEPEYVTNAYPGQVLTLTHYVTNTGNEAGTFYMIPSAGAAGLSTAAVTRIEDAAGNVFSNPQGVSDIPISLGVNEMITVSLRVSILETAAAGQVATPGLIVRDVVDPAIQAQVINQIVINPAVGTRYVAIGGNDVGNNCLISEQPCATLQHAVHEAAAGDSILVAGGVYTDQSTYTETNSILVQNLFINKSINIVGGYSTIDNFAFSQPITNATVLDGQGNRRVIYVASGHEVSLQNLFVQNGVADLLDDTQMGSGIYNAGSDLTLNSTWVLSNTAVYGSGLFHQAGHLSIHNSVFAHNRGEISVSGLATGGGLYAVTGTLLIENNTFVNNSAPGSSSRAFLNLPPSTPPGYGGAIYQDSGTLTLRNNIFSANEASDGFAVYISATLPITANYNLYFNNFGDFDGTETNFLTGPNSFQGDPIFVDTLFHIGPTSAAKDSGTSQVSAAASNDFEGDARPQGAAYDIGADERVQRASFTFEPISRTVTILPNGSHVFTHTLTNIGDNADTYTLTLESVALGDPSNWTHSLTPDSSFVLNSGDSQLVTLVVSGVVAGDVDLSTITANAGSGLQLAVVDTTIISSTAGVDIGPSLAGSGMPGETVQYTHTLTNTGDGLDRYDLWMSSAMPSGWIVAVDPLQTAVVPAGSTVPFTVSVTIPADTAADTRHIVEIGAVSLANGAVQDVLTDTTTVLPAYGLQLLPTAQAQSVGDEGTAVFTHTLTNLGNITDSINLSLTESVSWGAILDPLAVTLGPASSAAVTVTVPTPPNSGGRVHVADITAVSGHPGVQATAVNTTTILLENGVAIGPNYSRVVNAGEEVVYQFVITNTGNITDTFDFTQDGGTQGWVSGFSGGSVELPPDATATVLLTVTVPAATLPAVEDITTVTATSASDGSINASATATTRVRQQHGLLFAPDNRRVVAAGSLVTYTHTLTNSGNGPDTFAFAANSSQGWAVAVPPNIALGAGQAANVMVTVTVPFGPGNITDTMQVMASSIISPAFSALVTNTTVVTTTPGALNVVIAPDNVGNGRPGEWLTYQHAVTNTGILDANFALTANSSQGWTTQIMPTALSLAAGESAPVTVTVQIAPAAADGAVDLTTVTVQDVGMVVQDTAVNSTTVTGSYRVVIAPNNYATGAPGETLTYTHQVTNTGDFADSYALSVSSSQNWATVTPTSTDILYPGESTWITVTVDIPDGTANGQIDTSAVTVQSLNAMTVNDTAVDVTIVQVPENGAVLEPDNSGAGIPGDTLTYYHTLTNTSSMAMTFLLAETSSMGWDTTLTPNRVDNLGVGEAVAVTVTVVMPATAVAGMEDYTVVTVTAVGDPTVAAGAINHTLVEITPTIYEISVTPNNSGTGLPGEVLTYQHTVTNLGNITETFAVGVTSSQAWFVAVNPNTLNLAPGEQAQITVTVPIPASAAPGTVDETVVTVSTTAAGANVSANATNTTNVNTPEPEDNTLYLPLVLKPCMPTGIDLVVTHITILPNPPVVGQPATVNITIRNQGTVDMDPTNNFYLDFYVDREPLPYLWGDLQWGVQARPLTAGASVSYNGAFTFSGGVHQLWAQVDTDRTVNECPFEDNNIFGPITISLPGTALQDNSPPQPPQQTTPRGTPTPAR